MSAGDLDQVIALDAQAGDISRRDFFNRRWQAMQVRPESHIALIATRGDTVSGFVLGHILTGEFGAQRQLAIIDAMAVTPEGRGGGIGTNLMAALKVEAKQRGCAEIRTMADWSQHDLLRFFGKSGFFLAPLNVLEKSLVEST